MKHTKKSYVKALQGPILGLCAGLLSLSLAVPVLAQEAAPASRPDPEVIGPDGTAQASGATIGTVVTMNTARAAGVSPQARVLPEHLLATRQARSTVETPKGYRAAWTDGRLNARRAEQTLQGQAQMLQVWTNTVPMRLID